MASFGVFDGHNGSLAADTCSKELCLEVVREFLEMKHALEVAHSPYMQADVISQEDREDALLCEALRRASEHLNAKIRATEDESGTAMCSLFLSMSPTKSIRCICANIGDSRCVLYTQAISSIALIPYNRRSRSNSLKSGDTLNPVMSPLKSYKMSEDHTLALMRERSRVLGKLKIENDNDWMNLKVTSQFINLPAAIVSHMQTADTPAAVAFEVGYPAKERLYTAEVMIGTLPTVTSPEEVDAHIASEAHITDNVDKNIISMSRRLSFINNDDMLVGRNGKKSKITRSIGDRDGPNACIAIPEMTAVTIKPDESGRFILASQGLWSTMSEEVARPDYGFSSSPLSMCCRPSRTLSTSTRTPRSWRLS